MNTRVDGKVFSLPYYAIVIFEVYFPANVFHEITEITDALKNGHDQNEQIIRI